ncbi:MAG: ribonuclease P protein component 4 [Candidatus Micrarchaeota archaeon]|nr:ribonuclease P protein component 4 [Candidatus Micrarchaeota archaeon]
MQKFSLRQLVYERIDRLLSLAEIAFREGKSNYAKRYVFIARKLSLRYNCRLPPRQKCRFCKICCLPLIPGLNAKVRLSKRTRSAKYSCCGCGKTVAIKYCSSQK